MVGKSEPCLYREINLCANRYSVLKFPSYNVGQAI